LRVPVDQQFAAAGRAVAQAAGALAVIASSYTQRAQRARRQLDGQVAELLVIAACLELATLSPLVTPQPDRRTC